VQVGSGSWLKVTAGVSHTLGIMSNGTLWAWGANGSGQLGIGNVITRSSPVQVGTATDWKDVTGSEGNTFALKTTGTLWGWGINSSGELGFGDTTNKSSPVQIGSATNWKKIEAAALDTHILGIQE
jgi:alpha-tubulin suppressor-like RCC1 family protein